MPTRREASVGAPCWIDLSTPDIAGARTCYTGLLGWEAEEPDEAFGGYFNFTSGGHRVAGCVAIAADNPAPAAWTVYPGSSDAVATATAVADGGGQVHVPAGPVGDLGSMAVAADPTGAAFGVWQPGTHPGLGILAEPGAPT